MSVAAWGVASALIGFALVYLAIGRGVVGAAHDLDPSLRTTSQSIQFLGVVFWLPIIIINRRRARR